MRFYRRLSALALIALIGLLPMLAVAADIVPVKGDPIKGDVLSLDAKEIVYKQGDKKVTKSIKEILKIEYREVPKFPKGTTYAMIELTDGSQLLAKSWGVKKKDLEFTMLAGPKLTIPTSMVSSIMNDAHEETNRRDWKTRIFNTRGKEAVVDPKAGNIICTIGEGSEDGTKIDFAVNIGGEIRPGNRTLSGLRGLIFKNVLDTKAPPAVCRLLDTVQDVVIVASITASDAGTTITTPAGAKIEFRNNQVAALDYQKGRFEYISDLEPTTRVGKADLDDKDEEQWSFYKDSNLNLKPMSVGGAVYSKGLAIRPKAELVFDLKGDFRRFEAVAGLDDGGVAANGTVTLIIEADGKEMTKLSISSDDKTRHKALVLNIKDVQKLRILVEAGSIFDSVHLNLADAKIYKE